MYYIFHTRITGIRPIYRSSLCLRKPFCSRHLSHLREMAQISRSKNSKPEYPQYTPVEDAELIDDYETGGYHPIHIGDRLGPKDRFHIVHKLGFGGHSTVWLARDEKEGRYVALKVAIAANSNISRERSIIQELEKSLENRRNVNVPRLRAAFAHVGPNGVHECLATDPGMCSLSRSKSASHGVWLFDLAVARKITAQLIRTISFLHSRGIAHGDLHLGNVLLKLPDLSSMSVDRLYAKYGEPIKEDVIRLDGASLSAHVPRYVVIPAWLGKKCEDVTLADAEILLTDFGESWKPTDTSRYTLNTPALYRPPEAMFATAEQHPIGLAADIWTLGCSIFALFGQLDLFEGFYPNEDDVFAENISALGKPPQKWWNLWRARQEFFNDEGEWAVKASRVVDGEYCSLETRVDRIKQDRRGGLGDEEMADLVSMLQSMLKWRPEDRVSALDLAMGTWMTKWGNKIN
ncbi:kinase domain-containing protein [Xylariaceae sp. AK1471]|nr:kinase domain-containing protein [Xylariaceae sp. AK1471]